MITGLLSLSYTKNTQFVSQHLLQLATLSTHARLPQFPKHRSETVPHSSKPLESLGMQTQLANSSFVGDQNWGIQVLCIQKPVPTFFRDMLLVSLWMLWVFGLFTTPCFLIRNESRKMLPFASGATWFNLKSLTFSSLQELPDGCSFLPMTILHQYLITFYFVLGLTIRLSVHLKPYCMCLNACQLRLSKC